MKALIGTRKATTLLRLAVALAIVGSVNCVRGSTDLARNDPVCFLIDGQVYCLPGTEGDAASIHAGLEPWEPGLQVARSEDRALAIQGPQSGEAAAAGDRRPV
jgi:hypothetical protein